MAKSARKIRYRPHRIRRGAGRVKCFRPATHPGNDVCIVAGRYGFDARLYAKGHSYPEGPGNYLPLAVGRARTMSSAAAGARQFLRKLKSRRLNPR